MPHWPGCRRETHPEARSCSVSTSPKRAFAPGWKSATARWRTRRPICGNASPWWKRQMRFVQGPEYEKPSVDVHAVRGECRSRREVLRELRRRLVRDPTCHGTQARSKCADCDAGNYVDEYCTVCGNRRTEPDRDENQLDAIVLVTDRGLEHARNEDAGAAGTVSSAVGEESHPIAAVVCDGIST